MSQPVPAELAAFIKDGTKFIIAGHKEPDGDCVGSQLALCSVLRRMDKTALPCSAGPFKRTEVMPYAAQFSQSPNEKERDGARVIIVDCSAPERTGDLAACIQGLPTAYIDHHASGEHSGSSMETPVFRDINAPSVTFMILSLMETLGLCPEKAEADLLLFGLCTDTGFFRHLDSGSAETFAAVEKLVRAGANPKLSFQAINGGKSLNSRIMLGHILSRAEAVFKGRLIVSYETYEDVQRLGPASRDSDMLYQLLQSVSGVEAIVIIREETPGNCTVGLRSRDRIDVSAIAASFGGGGHRNAAGFSITGTISNVNDVIIDSFKKIFY
jgi:phosphoesterase RecJ-like protein